MYITVTVYVFIFVGVNFRGFRGHLVIRENNIFVNPRTIQIHKNFSCLVAALLAQRSISLKVLPYSLPCDDGITKICTISLSFITETAKRSEFFLFLYVTSFPYLLILVIKFVITPNCRINKTVCTWFITTKNNTHEKVPTKLTFKKHENLYLENKDIYGI